MPSKRSPLKLQKKFHFYSSFPPIPAKPNFPSQCKYYRVHAEELGLENHCQWKKEPFIFYTESQTLVILEMFHPSPQYVLSSKLFMINTTDSFQIPSSNLPSIAKEWVRKTKAESKLFPAYTINHQQLHIYPTSPLLSNWAHSHCSLWTDFQMWPDKEDKHANKWRDG